MCEESYNLWILYENNLHYETKNCLSTVIFSVIMGTHSIDFCCTLCVFSSARKSLFSIISRPACSGTELRKQCQLCKLEKMKLTMALLLFSSVIQIILLQSSTLPVMSSMFSYLKGPHWCCLITPFLLQFVCLVLFILSDNRIFPWRK